jgi:phospholipid transport system substrate-binding protein
MVLDFLKREKIRYESEEKSGSEVVVRTRIVKMEDEIPVDYHLRKVGEKWLVFDVDIDEVSIVGNYRRSFSRVIKRTSFETLMKKMKMQQQAIKESYAAESAG